VNRSTAGGGDSSQESPEQPNTSCHSRGEANNELAFAKSGLHKARGPSVEIGPLLRDRVQEQA